MTVITMPSSEKKADNVPLVTNIEIDPTSQEKDLEAGKIQNDRVKSRFLVFRVINDRVYSMWALIYVLLMSLFIVCMMLYGEDIYRAVENAFSNESNTYYGTGTIAINDPSIHQALHPEIDFSSDLSSDFSNDYDRLEDLTSSLDRLSNLMNNDQVFSEIKEDFELDLKDENFEKIVASLPLSNSARFIHDFSANVTGIVDVDGKRCFVMPLNRSSVLPPKSLYDLLFKMSSGYYAVDTNSVMHNMRAVQPPIKDLSEYGIYIAKDCEDYPTYKLEKIVTGVFKRSVSNSGKTFSVFSGQMMDSFRISNYHDVDSQ